MSKLIPAAERLIRARKLIEKARGYPLPADLGYGYFTYVAEIKDILRQARDLIKFIPNTPSATADMKTEVRQIQDEIDQAEKELLHRT